MISEYKRKAHEIILELYRQPDGIHKNHISTVVQHWETTAKELMRLLNDENLGQKEKEELEHWINLKSKEEHKRYYTNGKEWEELVEKEIKGNKI